MENVCGKSNNGRFEGVIQRDGEIQDETPSAEGEF